MNIDNNLGLFESRFLPRIEEQNQQRLVTEAGRDAFELFFQAARDVVNETNAAQFNSDMAQMNFATGRETNMLTVILAQERANSTLNFTVQVSNRIIEAYREIMRMQV